MLRRSVLLTILLNAVLLTTLGAQASTVVLVRHAEKAAPSGDPDLSEAGRRRAGELAQALQRFGLSTILVTQYRRTAQTAEPTGATQHVTPQAVPAGADVASHARDVAAALRRAPAGTAALVVGHSNTLGPIIAALGGPEIPDLCDGEYATVLVLELLPAGAPRLLLASYGTPDPADAADCHHDMRLPQ